MAALSPPRFFAAWRVEAPFFCGFPFRWALQFVFSLVRCLTLQDAAPRYREDSLYECGRPHDTLSCLFFTALWLRQSQSILTQVQQTDDVDLTCHKTLPTRAVTCLQVGPMSLEWPVAQPAGSDQSSVSPHLEDALPALPHPRWRRDASQPPLIQRATLDRNTCVHITDGGLRCVTWNTRGLIGSPVPSQRSWEQTHNYFRRFVEKTTSYAFKTYMGRLSFSRPFRYWLRDSGYLVRLHQATQIQEALPYAFIKTYCLTMQL